MRIIAGKYRGLKLNEFEFDNIRPTIDRVRESIFNKIQFRVANSKVLDLFSGTGAVSLEFMSRGASEVISVDNNRNSVKLINQNFKKANLTTKLLEMDYMQALKKLNSENRKFDIIFLDPPFMTDYADKAIHFIAENNILQEEGIIIYEHNEKETFSLPENLVLTDEKKYGTIKVSYLERKDG